MNEQGGLDPLGFVVESLITRGALVEGGAAEALAVLPVDVARSLGIPEEVRLALDPATKGAVPCGFGAPLLEELTRAARATVPVAWVRLESRSPSPAQAMAAAGKFVLRNGLADVLDAVPGEAVYLAAHFALSAEADDRYETGLHLVTGVDDGGEPDAALAAALDPLRPSPALVLAAPRPLGGGLEHGLVRATHRAREALASFCATVARRRDRDRARIDEYFDGLVADARAPRRLVPEASIRAKVEHIEVERRQKLADLDPRFTVRATVKLSALVVATVPATRVRLRIRRRKAEAEITILVPADVRSPDRLACAGCARTTIRPVACDDRLHLLCETCAPSAQGRPRCAACRRR